MSVATNVESFNSLASQRRFWTCKKSYISVYKGVMKLVIGHFYIDSVNFLKTILLEILSP